MPTGRLRLRLPNGQYKEEDKVVKLLGIYLDSGLTFKEHINRTIRKARQTAYQLGRIGGQGKGVPGAVLRQLYQACVIPILTYGVQVWGHKCTKAQSNKMEQVQNMALKRILGATTSTPETTLQVEVGFLPFISEEQVYIVGWWQPHTSDLHAQIRS